MIISYEFVSQEMQRLLRTKKASSYFLNGTAGVGKTFLLNRVADQFPRDVTGSTMFGPYLASDLENFRKQFLEDLIEDFYIDVSSTQAAPEDFFSFWSWLKGHLDVPHTSKWVLIFDAAYENIPSMEAWRPILSGVRVLESNWEDGPMGLNFIVSGYWDPQALFDYYRDIHTSFPYTDGENYTAFTAISDKAIRDMLVQYDVPNVTIDQSLGLFKEFTGGHPGVMRDVLTYLNHRPLTMENLMTATQEAASSGPVSKQLLSLWKVLPKASQKIISALLKCQQYPYTHELCENLIVSGVGRIVDVWGDMYVQIKSHYVQLLLRQNLGLFRVDAAILGKDDYCTFLIPALSHNNILAYQIIYNIENMIRNILSRELMLLNENEEHFLSGRAFKNDRDGREVQDAYERAYEWRDRSLDTVEVPLIAYLSTRDLAILLAELSRETKKSQWSDMGKKVMDLADIRDAVMHNQMIGGKVLQDLVSLQKSVYHLATKK